MSGPSDKTLAQQALASDPNRHFVKVPDRARHYPPATKLSGKDGAEFHDPASDRLPASTAGLGLAPTTADQAIPLLISGAESCFYASTDSGDHPPSLRGITHRTIGGSHTESRGFTHRAFS